MKPREFGAINAGIKFDLDERYHVVHRFSNQSYRGWSISIVIHSTIWNTTNGSKPIDETKTFLAKTSLTVSKKDFKDPHIVWNKIKAT